jgi:inhibitor of cysteine peptidase
MIRRVIVGGLAWLCLASAILAQQSEPSATAAPAKTSASAVTVTDQDNGKGIELAQGGTLIVQLPSNPSTGYSWGVKGDCSPLKLVKSDYKQQNQSSQKVGAPGTQVLQMKAIGPGTATLNLEYRRPWEKDVPPAKVFSIKVTIR